MTLDDFLQAARSCLGDLGNQLSPEAGTLRLEREAEYLRLKLRRNYDGLMRQRRLVEGLHHHITNKDRDARALTCRVESYLQEGNQIKAWHHALELDRMRASLERDRTELGRLQRVYHQLVADIARMEKRATQVNEQLTALRLQPAQANG